MLQGRTVKLLFTTKWYQFTELGSVDYLSRIWPQTTTAQYISLKASLSAAVRLLDDCVVSEASLSAAVRLLDGGVVSEASLFAAVTGFSATWKIFKTWNKSGICQTWKKPGISVRQLENL